MKITIDFDTETAAFEDNRFMEATRVMAQVRDHVRDSLCGFDDDTINRRIRDSNGNWIGKVKIEL